MAGEGGIAKSAGVTLCEKNELMRMRRFSPSDGPNGTAGKMKTELHSESCRLAAGKSSSFFAGVAHGGEARGRFCLGTNGDAK